MKKNGLMYLWAMLCFVPAIFFYYVGEEGAFTLMSMEMWRSHEYMSTVMYGATGGGGGRPPLFNWLMIPLTEVLGWENVLVASRMVTVAATFCSSMIIGWLAQQIWNDKQISWLAALLYLVTADVLLYRGWLAYADPLFSMLVFLSIALVWVACLRGSYLLLIAAMLAAFAAFLAKALTVYVFMGLSLLVFIRDKDFRRFLLRPQAWIVYLVAILMLVAWFKFGTHDTAQHNKMSNDILEKLSISDWGNYLGRIVLYPVEMILRLMPGSLFIGYFLLKKPETLLEQDAAVKTAALILLVNIVPYWFAPYGGARYVLPIYPFIALVAAWLIVRNPGIIHVQKWIVGMLMLGSVMHLVAFPWYQQAVRGESYVRMADEIVEKYGQYPLYVTDATSVGLSVAANIDSKYLGRPSLVWPPSDFTNGIVIARSPEDVPGKLLRELHGNRESVFLICRGAACAAK